MISAPMLRMRCPQLLGKRLQSPATVILGLGPLISCVGQPLMTERFNRKEGLPLPERRSLLIQEIIRQGISAAITIGSFAGGIFLGNKSAQSGKGISQALWIVGLNFIGYSLFRPWVTSKVLALWDRNEQFRQSGTSSQSTAQVITGIVQLQQQRFQQRQFESFLRRTNYIS